MRWMFVLGAGFALLLAACGSSATNKGVVSPTSSPQAPASTLLDAAAFRDAIAASGAFVVNVHIPYAGEIEGTDAFVPFDRVEENIGSLPGDKSAPLYVYCRSGRMSAEAAVTLATLGYTNVIELRGGMDAWTAAGFPLIRRQS